jgi:copper chaperone NosL
MKVWSRLLASVFLWAACSSAPSPAPLAVGQEGCRSCRMVVSDARFAAQVVAPGEEPLFFDDVGCLRDFLRSREVVRPRATAYVADHRTREWVRAADAVYTRAAIDTPMGSRLLAHAGAASRAADADAASGSVVSALDIFGPEGPPDARGGRGEGR